LKKHWKIKFSDVALKSLKKMDKFTAAMILGYIEKNLGGYIDPRSIGKPLVGNHKDKWRYRIGKCRILCQIKDDVVTIYVVQIGHRKDIYKYDK
jgi:mRNA interferase RelE/StbE